MGLRVCTAFTDRDGGVSPAPYDTLNLAWHTGDDPARVARNRALAAGRVGADPASTAWMANVHGREVAMVDRPTRDDLPGTDALVTTTPGLALTVLAADCPPVLLVDEAAGVVATVHSGWRGTRLDIAAAAVDAMLGLGARPHRMRAVIGPAACGRCYEVGPDVQEQVCAVAPEARSRTRAGTPGLDLPAAIAAQLRRCGVGEVEVDPRCTIEDPQLYSYRRDGRTGRFAGLAVLVPA